MAWCRGKKGQNGGDLGTVPTADPNAGNTSVPTSANTTTSNTSAPSGQGKIIVVSISQEELDAYDNGQLFVSTPVATGRPQLPTLTGTYHIFAKLNGVWAGRPRKPTLHQPCERPKAVRRAEKGTSIVTNTGQL